MIETYLFGRLQFGDGEEYGNEIGNGCSGCSVGDDCGDGEFSAWRGKTYGSGYGSFVESDIAHMPRPDSGNGIGDGFDYEY